MNIFFLSLDPSEAARRHGDKHVIKMILESTQMLITCWHCMGSSTGSGTWTETFQRDVGRLPYKKTHANHPCNVWIRASPANYRWLCRLGLALCDEKRRRWPSNPEHQCRPLLDWLGSNVPTTYPPGSPRHLTAPARAMPDEYKVGERDDISAVIRSYARYYVHKEELGIVTFKAYKDVRGSSRVIL